jgi:CrcB protein
MLKTILIIGSGGFLGSISRYLLAKFVQESALSSFPWGTFFVNVLGCFLIGLFYGLAEKGTLFTPGTRLFLTVGFCGGFTTFSTFAHENLALMRDGAFSLFLLYTGLSIFLGLIAVYLGHLITKIL